VKGRTRSVFIGAILITLSILFLEGLRFIAGANFTTHGVMARWGFVAITLILARVTQNSKGGIALAILGFITGFIYASTSSTTAAWMLLSMMYALLLWVSWRMSIDRSLLVKLFIYCILALLAGSVSTAIGQIESRFSEEEFYAVLQALEMAFIWGILALSNQLWHHWSGKKPLTIKKVKLAPFGIGLALLIIGGTYFVVKAYQHSFYPSTAPGYEGISSESPYICGEIIDPQLESYSGEEIFNQILELVEANPNKESPEFGMLALGYKESDWAIRFRDSLLEEARQGRFTLPNNSVKFSQYEAALRAYYYPRVMEAFQELFSQSENQEIREWFESINQRTQTVEWVDWMYALAYNKKPQGPYENQEIGAGLLAILETEKLADSKLSADNRTYLAENPRGWNARFRNTDDAAVYQPEWINNALFQSLYTGELNIDNLALSFKWLSLLAIPDGAPLRYNHIGSAVLGDTGYQIAGLLEDKTALWVAGRSVDYLFSKGGYLRARPGVESPVVFNGSSPGWGSCLLYGDSGLPNQVGPLAPDKVVLRDGWEEDSVYMLINLRFTGWHRYKATNTVTLLYQGGALVNEISEAEPSRWLPTGRRLFRDKRIPRENLNGLLIERTGLSAVLQNLTGIGSSWAQDPPYYAMVERFETSPEVDISYTKLKDWHGWEHDRIVYFNHDGPIIVVDETKGIKDQQAAISWHVIGRHLGDDHRIQLTGGMSPAEMLLITNKSDKARLNISHHARENEDLEVQYLTEKSGQLSLVTVFLIDDWVGAEAFITRETGGPILEIVKGDRSFKQPLEFDL